ncbi:hypothetical protein BJ878DRAFT_517367 [Calycina marina]|uniref:Calmodulin n=1 Tax=Calycina marina TaxID=1763456 RepID=A0A9P8CCV7_9HELO|nr:hypothetical protein BJ878DRAFT_517367 [Calycina marina]
MAEQAPSLNLTPEEKRVFGQLFREADTDGLGVVTGEIAVKFFEKTRLEPRVLGEIWQIADTENRGLLTPAGFGIVLRLIGHYQAGREPTPELAQKPGPLPRFEGGVGGGVTSPTGAQPPPGPPPSGLQPQASGSGPIRVPPLTREKAAQYAMLFEKSGATNGFLQGEQARQIFERAALSNEILGRIWTLADTEQRGALVVTEFAIAMHLLASMKSGAMRALPNILPPGLYEAARPPSRQSSATGAMFAVPRQLTGAGAQRTGSPLARPAYTVPQQFPQSTGMANDWAITPGEKEKYDKIYYGLDKTNKGFIEGAEAVPFFSESKLPEEALAQIWDLADINSEGRLTRDEFSVAMYLIRQQRSKRDGRESLPATLPANLIPPSMRNQLRPTNLPTAPAFENPVPTLPKSAAEDLFGLDALSTPPPIAPTQAPHSTGGSFGNDPFGSQPPISPTSPPRQQTQQSSSVFKPFTPSSSFGQTLSYQPTGDSTGSSQQQRGLPQQSSHAEDLLGDNDPEVSSKLTSETTELASLANQVGTLSRQMQDVQGQKVDTQTELNQTSSQKRDFEVRLGQLRSLYEQEAKDVRALEEKLNASRQETKKLQTDIAMIEGTYADLQNQHRQVLTALQADQQENTSLKERMRTVNNEIVGMKPALEKLRSDARQQKGLVAINKKQLATSEGEREKLKTEAADLNKCTEDDKKELAAASVAAAATSRSLQVASPASSTMSVNNPFFRRQDSSAEIAPSPFVSPAPATGHKDQSFENVFGPAFAAGMTNEHSAPPTSFRQDSEVRSLSGSTSTLPPRAPSAGSGFPSPTGSPMSNFRELSQSNEAPPPPPESRQISSTYLPFAGGPTESVSSSRQVSAPNSRFEGDHAGVDTPTNEITPTGSSVAGGHAESIRAVSPGLDRKSNDSQAAFEPVRPQESIPGAFPDDLASPHVVDTPTGGTTLSEQAAASPFAVAKEVPASAKNDFDSAFAGFGSSAKPQERSHTGTSSNEGSSSAAPSGFHKEFPPIAELEDDDDSDSVSETGGFDDDFAPGSPGHTRNSSSIQTTTHPAPTDGTNTLAIPHNGSALSLESSAPPTPGAQAPSPYDKPVTSGERAHSEVQEFSGLPTREIPMSPPATGEQTSAPQVGQIPFESTKSPLGAPTTSAQAVPPAAPAKVPFDDDFDEFDDLEDAKEGDADDDFANLSVNDHRSGLDDFNSVFDSAPAPPAKQAHSPEQPTQLNTSSHGASNAFEEYTQSPVTAQPQAPANTAVNDNHDWDAIFAGLDTPAPVSTSQPEPTKPAGNASGLEAPAAAPERPIVGRALTEAGLHDDPILKNLTGMGYNRNNALAALEKYDYNLARAADFLASQS